MKRFGLQLLDRYVLREMLVPFLIGTVAVTLMFDANLVIYLGKSFNLAAVPVVAIFQYILAKTPSFLNMTLPVGMAMGGSLAMSRLARESELTAMRTAGASIKRCLLPFLYFGLLVGALDYWVNEYVIPKSEQFAGSIERQMGALMVSPTFVANTFFKLDKYQVSIGAATRTGREGMDVRDIVLISRLPGDSTEIVTANSGTYDHGLWKLRDTTFRVITGDELTQFKKSGQIMINDLINLSDIFLPPPPEQLSVQALWKSIQLAHKEGRDARMLEVQFHGRFSLPLGCLLFGVVAPLVAIPFAKSGSFAGILCSVFLVFLYYNSYIISTEIIGRNGWLSPMLSSWLTNIIFMVIGLIAAWRLE